MFQNTDRKSNVTEKITIGGDEHEIEVKQITLICKSEKVLHDVKYEERIPIDIEASFYHMERVKVFHPLTEDYIRQVFDYKGSCTPDEVRRMGSGFKHFGGRIDLTLKLMSQGVPIAWVHPEDCLHPAAQARLADVLIEITSPGRDNKLLEKKGFVYE